MLFDAVSKFKHSELMTILFFARSAMYLSADKLMIQKLILTSGRLATFSFFVVL